MARISKDQAKAVASVARRAADRRKRHPAPLRRVEAPWRDAGIPVAWERLFRESYADRLEQLEFSLPAAPSGKRGARGKTVLVTRPLRQTKEEFD